MPGVSVIGFDVMCAATVDASTASLAPPRLKSAPRPI